MQTNNTTYKRNFNLWVGTIILSGLVVCLLTQECRPNEIKNTYAKRKLKANTSQALFDNQGPIVVNPSENGIYDTIIKLSSEECMSALKKWAQKAQRIIPQFPDFPKLWLLPPNNKGSYASKAERYCMEFMELLFPGYRFHKVRPTWLRNPKTNRCLELDGYCEELSLAIEYNGVQHYEWPNFLPMTQEEFYKQRERDQIKVEVCLERNICLLQIPYTVPFKQLPLAIYAKLLEAVPGLQN